MPEPDAGAVATARWIDDQGELDALVDELAGLGVGQVALYAMHDAVDATTEAYGTSVIG